MHIKFTFIILSEIWRNSDTTAFYNIAGYTHIYETRDKKIGGGVSIYIMKTIPFKIRKVLQLTGEHIESIFIEVDKSVFQSKCNVIVGALYKPEPRSLSIDIFAQYLYLQTVSLQQYKVQYPIKYNSMFFKRIEKYIKYYI